ncbi:KIS family RaS-RiPP peptide [Streptococcus ruminantium]|nr:hypothetical protein [Streptococcus ruminantium]BDD39548.1 hypothetical protein GUT183_17860 [Streptococcus ruminantium]
MTIEDKVTYTVPLLNKGEIIPVYACNQGTCNGKSHNRCSREAEEESKVIMLKKVV